jgi:acyl carrier protein
MRRDELEAGVRELLVQVTQADAAEVKPGFDCTQAAGWSSLQHLMLVSQLESRFGVTFTNREIPTLASYDAIVAALNGRLGAS